MGKVSDRAPKREDSRPPPPSAEMRELIRRIATFPRGLAFVDTGDLECVAVMFEVCPDVILEAREYLATASRRAWFIDQVREAQRSAPAPWRAPKPLFESAPPGPRTAAALIRAATEHEYGISFLLESPPETVAIVFCVHPRLVFRARALHARWNARRGAEPST